MIKHDDTCEVTCIDNGNKAIAEVGNFYPEKSLTVYISGARIVMKYKGSPFNVYIGNSMGLEFSTPGPNTYQVKEGRY